jgi:RNA recognition motif-containing protein
VTGGEAAERVKVGTKLFVGNLSFETQDGELREIFTRAGACVSAVIVMDRATSRSRGFGFVEMATEEEARRAVTELNGAELRGRNINVSEARERSAERPTSAPGRFRSLGPDRPPAGKGFKKDGKSRRGLRGRKRSIY